MFTFSPSPVFVLALALFILVLALFIFSPGQRKATPCETERNSIATTRGHSFFFAWETIKQIFIVGGYFLIVTGQVGRFV